MSDCPVHPFLLHVLTDRRQAGGRSDSAVTRAALEGGATVIQLRGKDLDGADLVATGHVLRTLTREAGALLIVNDRVDVALLVDADGVHVGQSDISARDARRLIGPRRLLGVSARTLAEAIQAECDGADYIGFGPVYETASKHDAGTACGLELLRSVRAAVHVPVVAIGGLSESTAPAVMAAGATGIAVISAVVGAPDICVATRRLRNVVQSPTTGGVS